MKYIIIDNYDSFTLNLEHLLVSCINEIPNRIMYDEIIKENFSIYDFIVISPGPGNPNEYPLYKKVFDSNKPILGICLGMEIINEYFGGKVLPLKGCVHGKTDSIKLQKRKYKVARYHSLYNVKVSDDFEIISKNITGIPMIIQHKTKKIIGYQFHPESFLTKNGKKFIDYAIKFFNINI